MGQLVYKYRNWGNDRHKEELKSCHFTMVSPKKLNDPYDCAVPIAYDTLITDPEERERFIYLQIKRSNPFLTSREAYEISKKEKDNPVYLNKEYIDDWNKKDVEKLRNMIVLFCGSLNSKDIKMWSHYANEHKGYCIGYSYGLLGDYIGTVGKKVRYEEYPKISPNDYWTDQFEKRLLSKGKQWEHEEEVRWYQRYTEDIYKIPFKYNTEIIQEVILGCQTSEEHKKEIIETVKSHYPHLKTISQAKLKSNEFGLDFETITI